MTHRLGKRRNKRTSRFSKRRARRRARTKNFLSTFKLFVSALSRLQLFYFGLWDRFAEKIPKEIFIYRYFKNSRTNARTSTIITTVKGISLKKNKLRRDLLLVSYFRDGNHLIINGTF